jgi:hypothetical protein
VYLPAIGVGGFLSFIGGMLLYVGMKTPEGEKVNWGFGTYYDRTGICFRAIVVLFIGAMCLTVGFLYQA